MIIAAADVWWWDLPLYFHLLTLTYWKISRPVLLMKPESAAGKEGRGREEVRKPQE